MKEDLREEETMWMIMVRVWEYEVRKRLSVEEMCHQDN